MEAAVASLIGVGLGGGFSLLGQWAVQRQAVRAETERRRQDRTEARRAERLELAREFIATAQLAERAAEERDRLEGDAAWQQRSLDVVDRLWVHERMVHVLFGRAAHDGARRYVEALSQVLFGDLGGVTWQDRLRGPKVTFLEAARAELGS